MLCWVFCENKQEYVADEIGVLSPNQMEADELHAGEVTSLVLCLLVFGYQLYWRNQHF
jgi:translation elongation factor EF-4